MARPPLIGTLWAVTAFLLRIAPLSAQVFDFPPSMPLDLSQPLDDDAQRLQRNAMVFESRGENEKALGAYRQLLAKYPEYDPFYEGVIRNYAALEQFAVASSLVDSLLAQMRDRGPAQSLTLTERERLAALIVDSGRLAGRLGRREEAFRRWDELYGLPAQPSSNAYFRLFSAMIECRFVDGLEEMTRKARKATGDRVLLAASLANYWAEHGQIERAVGELLLLLELQPEQADNIQRQILGFADNDESRRQLEESLKAAKSRAPLRRQVAELLGAFYFRDREWEKAYVEVREADRLGGGSGEALLSFAETLISESQAALAMKVLDDAAIGYPEISSAPRALLARAKALQCAQQYHAADSVYTLMTAKPTLRSAQEQEALLLQAKLRLEQLHQPQAARALLENATRNNPRLRNRNEITLLIGHTYLAERSLDAAMQTYLQAASSQPGTPPEIRSVALVNAALVDMYQGQFTAAAGTLNEASRGYPEGAMTNDALELLDLLRCAAADSTHLALFFQAQLEERLGHTSLADSLLTEITTRAQCADLAEKALWTLAQSNSTARRGDRAIAQLEELLKRFPQSGRAPDYLLAIGGVREETLGDAKGAIASYEKILVDFPNSLATQEARRRLRRLEGAHS